MKPTPLRPDSGHVPVQVMTGVGSALLPLEVFFELLEKSGAAVLEGPACSVAIIGKALLDHAKADIERVFEPSRHAMEDAANRRSQRAAS